MGVRLASSVLDCLAHWRCRRPKSVSSLLARGLEACEPFQDRTRSSALALGRRTFSGTGRSIPSTDLRFRKPGKSSHTGKLETDLASSAFVAKLERRGTAGGRCSRAFSREGSRRFGLALRAVLVGASFRAPACSLDCQSIEARSGAGCGSIRRWASRWKRSLSCRPCTVCFGVRPTSGGCNRADVVSFSKSFIQEDRDVETRGLVCVQRSSS